MLAILFAGFGLRVATLGNQSLWFDETYAAWIAAEGPRTIVSELSPDLLPLHFFIVSLLMRLAGHSEFVVRFSSLMFGTALLPLFYQVLRLFQARWTAVAGMGLLAISAFAIYYSQEARMEMLACFLVTASAYALIRAQRREDGWRWGAYAVCAAACLYTFYFTALVLLALNLTLLVHIRKPRRNWYLANAAAVALWLPWLAITLTRASAFLTDRVADLGLPSVSDILLLNTAGLEFGVTAHRVFTGAPSTLLLLVTLVMAWRVSRRPTLEKRLLLAWALIPTAILDVLNFFLPVNQARYFLIALPGWIAIAVLGFGDQGSARERAVLRASASVCGAIFALGTTAALLNNYTDAHYQRDDYRAAFALIKANALPDEAMVYDPLMQYTAAAYYGSDLSVPSVGLPIPLSGHQPVAQIPASGNDRPATDAALANLTAKYAGVWLLLLDDVPQWSENWLDNQRLLVSDRWFGALRLKHYRPAPVQSESGLPGGYRVAQDFGGMRLSQIRVTSLEPGRTFLADLLWRVTSRPNADYSVSLQLFDAEGRRWAQSDGPPLEGSIPTSQWTPDRSYPDTMALRLPANLPAGSYHLIVSVYDAQLNSIEQQQTVLRLPYVADQGSRTELQDTTDAGWSIDTVNQVAGPGGDLLVVASGTVQSAPGKDYTWFSHLLNGRGELVAQDDRPPLPRTSTWQPGDSLRETFRLPWSEQAASLELGAYDSAGQRVVFREPNGDTADHLQLALAGRSLPTASSTPK